jgi:predicted nucleotide-binding protein (sugar kinase/HSP70/actin superfamily)
MMLRGLSSKIIVLHGLVSGKTVQDFIAAMQENLASQTSSDIENNNVAEAFIAFFAGDLSYSSYTETKPYQSTTTKIFKALEDKATELGTNTRTQKNGPVLHQHSRAN